MSAGIRSDDGARPAGRLIQLGLLAVAGAAAVSALVGLPLFGDGAYYYFKLATHADPVVPNLRFTAVLAQLPAWAAARLHADALLVRHCFAAGYAALPVLSLLACWLAVRRDAPDLMLFPALSLLGVQVNFSAVSELTASLYLTWPLVLMMALAATRTGTGDTSAAVGGGSGQGREPRTGEHGKPSVPTAESAGCRRRRGAWRRLDAVQVYALCAGPLLLLHPLALAPGLLLSLLALLLARLPAAGDPEARRLWLGLGVWLAICALLRLGWTVVGANAYERSNLDAAGAAHYLLASTPLQHLLLALIVLHGLGSTLALIGRQRRPAPLDRLLRLGVVTLPVLAIALGAELLAGSGIKLKAALTFVVALALMVLAVIAARGAVRRRRADPGGLAPLFALCALAIVLTMLAKASAWWTATRGLQNVMLESEDACIEFGPQQPFGLQWPCMAVVDDWATPMNALAFRPRGVARWPIALLLP